MNRRHLRRAALAWAAEELFGATGQGLEASDEGIQEILRVSAELRRRAGIPDDVRCYTWAEAVEITRRSVS